MWSIRAAHTIRLVPDEPLRVAFVVNDLALSGGVGVVVQHARRLAADHEMDVTLVLARELEDPTWGYDDLEHLHVASLQDAAETEFDIAISTWWETAYALFSLRAKRYASFVQSLEDRFYLHDEAERFGAALVLDLPVAFITEATWIRDTLADLRPDASCYLVRNGIDKEVFPVADELPGRDGPLHVLVEGYASTWFKGVNEAIAAVGQMNEPHRLTVVAPDRTGLVADGADEVVGPVTQREMARLYGEADVVLKLSRVEGMYGPPLEGFHRGATVVTTEVTGHEEYVEHGVNGMVVDWDDLRGTARMLDLLAKDRELLNELRANALETARGWPSLDDSSREMATALRAIAAAPPPDPYAHVPRLLADIRAGTEQHRLHLRERQELLRQSRQLARVKSLPVVRQARAAKRRRPVQALIRLAKRARGR